MGNWAFDIDRQAGLDLWCWVALAATLVLALHWVVGRITHERPSRWQAVVAGGATVITLAVVLFPLLRRPFVGMVWCFALLILVSLTQYLELRGKLSSKRIGVLLALRVVALLLAVPMLFEPVLRFSSQKDPDRPLLLLVDASGSMSVPDVQNGPTRFQSVAQGLGGIWSTVTSEFKPQIIPFSGSTAVADPLDKPGALTRLNPDGQSTDLASAVGRALANGSRDDTQIVLLSDGLDNTSADVVGAIRASRRPISTVLVGSQQARPSSIVNVAIDRVDAGEEWTVRTAAMVKVNVRSSSLAGRIVDVNLAEVDDQQRPIGTPVKVPLVLEPSTGGQEVALEFTPQRVGVHRMSAWVEPIAGERSTADNRRDFQQLATDARIKLLYIEGRARPEYRELSRALSRDANVESATLLRVAGDRFAATGAVGGKVVKSLPDTVEQWRKFDIIILGDLDVSYLKPQQLKAIEQAVAQGAGLLMLGGQNSLGPGGFAQTPLETLLPVVLGGRDAGQDKNEFVPRLAPGAAEHPVMAGLAQWFQTDSGDGKSNEKKQPPEQPKDAAEKRKLPTLLGNVIVGKAKDGATVLLQHAHANDKAEQIVLAVQRYGKGRSAVFTADTTYRWYLPMRGLGQQSPYTTFWGQLVRWLAGADVKNRGTTAGIETLVDKTTLFLGEPANIRALVRDTRGDATRYAQVTLNLTKTGGNKQDEKTLALTPVTTRDGQYELVLNNLTQGDWEATVQASKDGEKLGEEKINFSVIAPADEMLKLAADPATLQRIAAGTGGYAYTLSQVGALIDLLAAQGGPQSLVEHRSVPLHNAPRALLAMVGLYPTWPTRFDLPTQTLLVIALLAGEWVLRRRWQLL